LSRPGETCSVLEDRPSVTNAATTTATRILIFCLPTGPTLRSSSFRECPEPKAGKNRLHLDLYTTAPEELIERLIDMGGERAGEPQGEEPGGWSFQVMLDPAGNEFCVCRES
jgi:hypothetical protein